MRNCHSSFTAAIQLTPIDPNDRIDKVRNFVNILDKNFQQMLIPGTHLSIDEAMIKYNGRLLMEIVYADEKKMGHKIVVSM